MNKIKTKIVTLTLVIALVATGLITWAIKNRETTVQVPSPEEYTFSVATPDSSINYNSQLLSALHVLAKKMNKEQVATYSGFMTMIIPQDSSKSFSNVAFTYSKDHNDNDYKLGSAEVLNIKGINLYVSHEDKRVILSPQQLSIAPMSLDMKKYIENLSIGDYELKSSVSGTNKTIHIVNNYNLDCKEYSITYDTVAMQLKGFKRRIADLDDPLNKSKETVIEVNIAEHSNQAQINYDLLNGKLLTKEDGAYKLINQYASYSLIQRNLSK